MQFAQAQIIIFAKAPVEGQVKTRLIPSLGKQQACALYQVCLDYIVQQRCTAGLAPVALYASPDTSHAVFRAYAQTYALSLYPQQGQGLGERMAQACRQALKKNTAVVLTGADAPALSNSQVAQALEALAQGADVVMVAAEDGGYVLLGLRRYVADLFTNMPWGSAQVAQLTRERCQALHLQLQELPLCWDIDRPEDVQRFARCFPKLWPLKPSALG